MLESELLAEIREAYRRVRKIIAKVKEEYGVNPDLLKLPEEEELYRALLEVEEVFENLPLEEKLQRLHSLKGVIDKFFDNVMVMAKEEDIRKNRIALLQRLKKLFERVANFEKVPVKGE